MTLSSAFSSALSGLTANTRMADLVASNLANSMTEGFAPRDVSLSSATGGQGVRVVGVQRQVDTTLLADRRLADTGRAASEVRAEFATALEALIGAPGALDTRMTGFESALVTAAARPEETVRLQDVLTEALSLVRGLNEAAEGVAALRQEADLELGRTVDTLNEGLRNLEDLNARITKTLVRGGDTSPLEDQRQTVIDALSRIVPLRELPRENGTVALVTTKGALLLDGRAVRLSFTPNSAITADMSVETGALSGLRMDNMDVPLDDDAGPFAGGRLSALFDLRDRLSVEATAQLDAIAQDLVTRFEEISTDPAQQAGLFTVSGQRPSPDPSPGLAERISVNAAVNPDQGGSLFRLRDGLDAETPGPPGDSSRLTAFSDALGRTSILPTPVLGGGARDAAGQSRQTACPPKTG